MLVWGMLLVPFSEKVTCIENICYGDYGGPLVPVGREDDSAMVIGVASVGMARSVNCDAEGFPDIYTYVPNYIPWIQSLMGA